MPSPRREQVGLVSLKYQISNYFISYQFQVIFFMIMELRADKTFIDAICSYRLIAFKSPTSKKRFEFRFFKYLDTLTFINEIIFNARTSASSSTLYLLKAHISSIRIAEYKVIHGIRVDTIPVSTYHSAFWFQYKTEHGHVDISRPWAFHLPPPWSFISWH